VVPADLHAQPGDRVSLSVIVASMGRPTLQRALDSIGDQLLPGDEVLVSVNLDAPWGHRARNQLMPAARGDMLLFMDDDDAYVPGALATVRERVGSEADRIHIFRMRYSTGEVLWRTPELGAGPGNVSTIMFCVPRMVALCATWGNRYEGDYDFIAAAAEYAPVAFHEDIIALVRPLDG
jgi:glycosyltransferase involved in cell wall biosynthesis